MEINSSNRSLIIRRLIGYPIIILICWLPSCIVDLSDYHGFVYANNPSLVLYTCLPSLQGFMTGSLFLILFFQQYLKDPEKYKVEFPSSPWEIISSRLNKSNRVEPIGIQMHRNDETALMY